MSSEAQFEAEIAFILQTLTQVGDNLSKTDERIGRIEVAIARGEEHYKSLDDRLERVLAAETRLNAIEKRLDRYIAIGQGVAAVFSLLFTALAFYVQLQ